MNTVLSDPVVMGESASLPTDVPRSRRGFWALIATQFQGAFSDNILRAQSASLDDRRDEPGKD